MCLETCPTQQWLRKQLKGQVDKLGQTNLTKWDFLKGCTPVRFKYSVSSGQVCVYLTQPKPKPLFNDETVHFCVSWAGEDPSPERDGDVRDWFTLGRRSSSRDTATEVTYPKRLVQQIESEEETAHGHLDTRVTNSTIDTSVSWDLRVFTPIFTFNQLLRSRCSCLWPLGELLQTYSLIKKPPPCSTYDNPDLFQGLCGVRLVLSLQFSL